ncbi:CRTAC1 family protein [Acidipila sp. EB88]|uniref:CRTAC1 family protein n=1 Tax=Acidipila sp. EB88 TaxID=2305226 RepID=UPI001F3E2903|nr:CRTAC1 family protein [Acidipila sp. EB88]
MRPPAQACIHSGRHAHGRSLPALLCLLLLPALLVAAAHTTAAQSSAAATAPATLPATLPQLVDITAKTGITFQHLSTPDKRYILDSMSGGVALIDFDRDGWPDIYFTNAPDVETPPSSAAGPTGAVKARNALYRNNHDGTFTDVTARAGIEYPCWSMGAVVGDYNNDGWPDLLVSCFGGVVLYRNNGNGTFTDVTVASGLGIDRGWATGAAFGDYDNDGFVDLFVPHYVALDLKDLPALGSKKTCTYHDIAVQCGPRGLQGSPDSLYRNNGNGTFTDVSAHSGVDDPHHYFGLTSVWSDWNDDGRLDLLVANDGEPNYLYRNDGSGQFTDVALEAGIALSNDGSEQANMGVALGDYLHTGRFSVAITHFSDEYTTLFRNDGKLSFNDVSAEAGIQTPTAPYVGWGTAFFDFDNDGWPDLVLLNGHVYPQVDSRAVGTLYREPKLLFLNQHNGTLRNISKAVGPALQVPQVSRGLAVGDLFRDGHLELVVENLEGGPMILQPQGGPSNHWVSFQLEGTASNRLALNARVRVTSGDLVQLDEVRSGGSYLSQNDLPLHFGLGSHDKLDTVEILWPSGHRETVHNLAVDHSYYVLEGQGLVPEQRIQPQTPAHR